MHIKFQALLPHLQKKMHAVYVLMGSDLYLLNEAVLQIKKAWYQRGESDEKIIQLHSTADWQLLEQEANSYSLFAENVLLDARLDKKTIDSVGKSTLSAYLQNTNPRCLIIIQANAVPLKQLQWLVNHEQVTVVQAAPLNEAAQKQWIASQLNQRSILYTPDVPILIHQYTQGNMLACAQVIEKLSLIHDETRALTMEEVKNQLIDQSEFQLYELADACLNANANKAIHLLRQACDNRTEPTLILWLLTQEIRLLIQLTHLLSQQVSFSAACTKLNIWSQRARSYEMTLKRLSKPDLYQLLRDSKKIDELIKTTQSRQVWQLFEQIALALCLGITKKAHA